LYIVLPAEIGPASEQQNLNKCHGEKLSAQPISALKQNPKHFPEVSKSMHPQQA